MLDIILNAFFTNFFAILVLANWSNQDVKRGQVHNLSLIIPVIISYFVFPIYFVSIFVPLFVVLTAVHIILRRKGLLGFADVIGIPFALMYLINLNVFGVITFVIVFSALIFIKSKEFFDKVLNKKIYGRIILMPILFLSYFIAWLVHLIILLLFSNL